MTTWTDPLDPHGDGTLRPGDPVFDAVMRGNAVMGDFRPDTGWEFEEMGTEQMTTPPTDAEVERAFQLDLDALLSRKASTADLYERILREMSSDDEWAVFHRRLHPEEYPQPQKQPLWRRVLFGVNDG